MKQRAEKNPPCTFRTESVILDEGERAGVEVNFFPEFLTNEKAAYL